MAMTMSDLKRIEYSLTSRDREILRLLRDTKCLFTYHIRRLCFTESVSQRAATRAANRNLKKLRELGLIDVLVGRRVGGVKAGSSSYIWYLTEQGAKLLSLGNKYEEKKPKRNRFSEPADSTLGHRMAVNECFVQLNEMARKEEDFRIKEVLFEPNNWCYYSYKSASEVLKPDLSIVTSHHGYEYRFFIEMDLSTESLDTILNKCIRYHKYLASGVEQEAHGVFPVVLFIVKDEKRKQKMEDAMRIHFKGRTNIFLVITPDEFEAILTAANLPQDRLC